MDYFTARAELRLATDHYERGKLLMYANACFTAYNTIAFVGSGWLMFLPFAAFHAGLNVVIARRLQWTRWYAHHLSVDVQMWEMMFTRAAGGRPQ